MVASHLGTAFLLALFVLVAGGGGAMDFDRFTVRPEQASLAFLLALVGFGTKAGFVPLHVWLPEAHPAAPSHVSAVMSGVMIKTGVYGILRLLPALGPPPAWWGWLLLAVGLASGIHGALFAAVQRDLKRLLAYSSVENAGIVALGIGIGLAGASTGATGVAALGVAGALLHVLNHACFKSLLFLGAGAVAHAARTRDMNLLGGLFRRMPWTATSFLTGVVAITALPPLNGFASEWLIYLAALWGLTSPSPSLAAAGTGVVVGLALIGGLAAVCFALAFGISFLGKPRSAQAQEAHDPGGAMRAALAEPALLLALAVVAHKTGFVSLSAMYAAIDSASWGAAAPALALLSAALLVVMLAENARLPVDDPATHLELTMIHEVMVLDHGGPDLALIEYGSALKLWLFAALTAGLVVPVRSGSALVDAGGALAGILGVGVLVGLVESSLARWRLVRIPQLLAGAGVMAAFALLLGPS